MTGQVPTSVMFTIILVCAISFLIPLFSAVYLNRMKYAQWYPFFVGCLVMLVFALIFESTIHNMVFSSAIGQSIRNNPWLYGLYGGLMAGLFEETGRLFAFKTALKNNQKNDANALMYGVGHGGLEMMVLFGVTMISNYIVASAINGNGDFNALMQGADAAQMQSVVTTMVQTPAYMYFIGLFERILAFILQISLSVLVWIAVVKKGKKYLFPVAIGIHFLVDACAAILSSFNFSVFVIEAVIAVFTAVVAFYAKKEWEKSCHFNRPLGK